ncbi:MAG: BCSC C-terminal domain-containing protein [Planctomycetes bacterium]|nr:BCSC C-terminal domain-containing protein [Planctomycetota bacterium]
MLLALRPVLALLLAVPLRAFAQQPGSPLLGAPQEPTSAPSSSLEALPRPRLDLSASTRAEGGDGRTDRLAIYRAGLRLAFSVADGWRLGVSREAVLYDNSDRDRLDLVGGYDVEHTPNEDQEFRLRFENHTEGDAEQSFTGAGEARARVSDALTLHAGIARAFVEESLFSAVGENSYLGRAGQVRSNLLSVGADFDGASADAHALAFAGVNEGVRVPTNVRWGASFDAGWSPMHPEGGAALPRIRAGWRGDVAGFHKDASGFVNFPRPAGVALGGYFSPQLWMRHELTLSVSSQIGTNTRAEIGGGYGLEQADSATTAFSEPRSASRASARLESRLASGFAVGVSYQFDDGGAAVREHVGMITLRIDF